MEFIPTILKHPVPQFCICDHEECTSRFPGRILFAYGKKAFEGICRTYLSEENGELQLGGICLVAGLGNKEMREGTFDYYMREPIVKMRRKALHR